jgi:hypothetical protein
MISRFDHDKCAFGIRASLAAQMRTQTEVCDKLGISRNIFNAFLRRRINLMDSDIEAVLKELGIAKRKELMAKLSAPASINVPVNTLGASKLAGDF